MGIGRLSLFAIIHRFLVIFSAFIWLLINPTFLYAEIRLHDAKNFKGSHKTQSAGQDSLNTSISKSDFPLFAYGADSSLDFTNNKLVPYKDQEEKKSYQAQVINTYLSQITLSLGSSEFSKKAWVYGNSLSRLSPIDKSLDVTEMLNSQIKTWCEYSLQREWNQRDCVERLKASLNSLTEYFVKSIPQKALLAMNTSNSNETNIDKYIQEIAINDPNSKALQHLSNTQKTMEYLNRLMFLESREAPSETSTYTTPAFKVGAEGIKGKPFSSDASRKYLHNAATNEYAHRVVAGLGHTYFPQVVWHNVNAIARLRRNNDIFLEGKGVNLKEKTDFHLDKSLKSWCQSNFSENTEDRKICLAKYGEIRNLISDLNELGWIQFDPKKLSRDKRIALVNKYPYRFEHFNPGSSEFEDVLVDVMVQEEARNPNSRLNQISNLISSSDKENVSAMQWFLDHGYKPESNHTFQNLTNTQTLSEPSYILEIKKMVANKNYVTPYFNTSKPLKQGDVSRSHLVQIPLNPASNNLGPCGSHHYRPSSMGNDAYAAPITACVFSAVLQEWKNTVCPDSSSGCRINWGDISHKDAIYFNDHSSHTVGNCIDIRPFQNGPFEDIPLTHGSSKYSQFYTSKFIQMALKYGAKPLLFNDKDLLSSKVKPVGGHDNHLHVCFPDNANTRKKCDEFRVDPKVCSSLGG